LRLLSRRSDSRTCYVVHHRSDECAVEVANNFANDFANNFITDTGSDRFERSMPSELLEEFEWSQSALHCVQLSVWAKSNWIDQHLRVRLHRGVLAQRR
jgi:hypothetical protein